MKKKVLIFINYFGKTSETFIADEIAFLSQQNEIDIEILHYGKDIPEQKVHGLNMPGSLKNRWLKSFSKINRLVIKSLKYRNGQNGSLFYLISFFKNHGYDTIYCHFGTNGKLIAQLKELGVIPKTTKLIVRFHGLDMNFKKYPIGYYDLLIKSVETVIAGSEYAIGDLVKYKFKSNEVVKLPVGIKISDSERVVPKLPLDQFQIVSVGRLIELKGHVEAIEIISMLNNQGLNVELTIVGSGPLLEKLKRLIQEKNLENKVTFINCLSHESVFELLKVSHLYLYSGIIDQTGRRETQGLANLEAMSTGIPIIASNLGGVTDYVIDAETGFLCEPGNIEQFAKKIDWIIKNYDSDRILRIRKNAVKMVSENYCQEDLNKKLLKLLIN